MCVEWNNVADKTQLYTRDGQTNEQTNVTNTREAIAKAKESKRNAQVNAANSSNNDVLPNQDNIVFSVSPELAPTFREIMSASKIEKKASADGDTWIRIVKS